MLKARSTRPGYPLPCPGRRGPVRVRAVAEVLEELSKGKTPDVPSGLNKYSSRITQPKSQGASQAMLYGTGLNEESINKPQVCIFDCAVLDTCT